MLVPDGLHILDHNGVLSWAAGSLLAQCLRDRAKTLPELNESLRAFYSENKVKYRIGDLRHGNLYEGGNASGLALQARGFKKLLRHTCELPPPLPFFPFPTRRVRRAPCARRIGTQASAQVSTKTFPKLRGVGMKGAAVKALAPWLASLVARSS